MCRSSLHISTTLVAKSFVPFPPSDQCVQRLTLTPSLVHTSWTILTSLSVSVIKLLIATITSKPNFFNILNMPF